MLRPQIVFVLLASFAGLHCGTTPTTTATPAATAKTPTVVPGFQTPESVLYDEKNDVYLVSNINGSPSGKDDNGFISRVSPAGEILALKWIDGAKEDVALDAPKGSAIVDGVLYVADIDNVRLFDANTGAVVGSVAVAGATFLNDVAGGVGRVVVSDTGISFADGSPKPTGSDAVWSLDTKSRALTPLFKGADALPRANGIVVDGDDVWVVFFGAPRLEHFNLAGSSLGKHALPAGSLDGIVKDPRGGFFISSWEGSSIYRLVPGDAATVAFDNLKAPADIGLDTKRNVLLIPHFMDNTVTLLPL